LVPPIGLFVPGRTASPVRNGSRGGWAVRRDGAGRFRPARYPRNTYNSRTGYAAAAAHPPETPMKGNDQVIDALNRALTIELTAINQYFIQARMCKNWGFLRLGAKHYEESIGEMKHADKIIERILFLEGTPEIARYDVIRVGTDVKEQFEYDLRLETSGVAAYNDLVNLCIQVKDNGTHRLALEILEDSEEHVDWLETQLNLIQTVGLERYLAENMFSDDEEGD
jgi:bacterioferritin